MILKPKWTLTNSVEFNLKCSKSRGFSSSHKIRKPAQEAEVQAKEFPGVREKGPTTSLSYEGGVTAQSTGLSTGLSFLLLLLTCHWIEGNANWGLKSNNKLEEAWFCKLTEGSRSFRDYLWILQLNEYLKCAGSISSRDLKAGGGSNPIWSQTDGLLRYSFSWIIKAMKFGVCLIKFGSLTVTLL